MTALIDPRAWLAAVIIFAAGIGLGELDASNRARLRDAKTEAAMAALVQAKKAEAETIEAAHAAATTRLKATHEKDLAAARRLLDRFKLRLANRRTDPVPGPGQSTGRSDGADPGTGLVRDSAVDDLVALTDDVASSLAAGRACQAFVAANHPLE